MIDQPIIAANMLRVLRTLLAKVESPVYSQSVSPKPRPIEKFQSVLPKYERTMRELLVPFT
jgi:hypothetical protein